MKSHKASLQLFLIFLSVFTLINLTHDRVAEMIVHGRTVEMPMLRFFIGAVILGWFVSLVERIHKRRL